MYMCGNLDIPHHLSEPQLLICKVGIIAEPQRVIMGIKVDDLWRTLTTMPDTQPMTAIIFIIISIIANSYKLLPTYPYILNTYVTNKWKLKIYS